MMDLRHFERKMENLREFSEGVPFFFAFFPGWRPDFESGTGEPGSGIREVTL